MELQTGDIIKASVVNIPLIYHRGIVVREEKGVYVWHNCPKCYNTSGGSIVKVELEKWLYSRDIISVSKTNLTKGEIEHNASFYLSEKFDLLKFNCEHFTSAVSTGIKRSQQICTWKKVSIAVLLLAVLFTIYKVKS